MISRAYTAKNAIAYGAKAISGSVQCKAHTSALVRWARQHLLWARLWHGVHCLRRAPREPSRSRQIGRWGSRTLLSERLPAGNGKRIGQNAGKDRNSVPALVQGCVCNAPSILIAAAHMMQGSHVTYKSVACSSRRSPSGCTPCTARRALMSASIATSSACRVAWQTLVNALRRIGTERRNEHFARDWSCCDPWRRLRRRRRRRSRQGPRRCQSPFRPAERMRCIVELPERAVLVTRGKPRRALRPSRTRRCAPFARPD